MARNEKQYHFIYKTTNLLNGKYYYGMHSTDNINDGYYGSGKRLRYSLNKYGKENHKVEHLEFLPDRKSLIEREREIINLNEIAKEDCMNLIVGGSGGCQYGDGGKIHANRIKNDPEYAKKHLESWNDRIKTARLTKRCGCDWSNRKHSSEEKRIMSEKASQRFGKKNSQYGTCWITDGIKNKKIKKGDFFLYQDNWNLGRILKSSLGSNI